MIKVNELAQQLFGRHVYGGSHDGDLRDKAQAEVVKQFGPDALAVDGKRLPAEMAGLLSRIAGDTRKQTLEQVASLALLMKNRSEEHMNDSIRNSDEYGARYHQGQRDAAATLRNMILATMNADDRPATATKAVNPVSAFTIAAPK